MARTSTTFDPDMQSSAYDEAASALERARSRSREAAEDAADLVRRHPGRTLMISFLAGAAIGALIVNRALQEAEPSRWERLGHLSEEGWNRLRSGTGVAMTGLRDLLRSTVGRYR